MRVVAHGLLQRPAADFEDKACFLEQRDELERRHQAALGAQPPDQRLDADHAPGVGFDLGLVVQDELLPLERLTQLVLQGKPLRDPLGELVGVEEVALVRFLCLLERGLGVLEEGVRVGSVVREHRKSDLGRDPQLGLAYAERRTEALSEPLLGKPRDFVLAVDAREHHGKAVGRHTGKLARVLHVFGNPPRDLLQQFVARRAAERIVDGLEPVHVHEPEGELVSGSARRVHETRQALAEERRVREPRKGIVVGKVVEPLALLDVLERESDVAGELEQQPHFVFVVKEARRVGIQREHSDWHFRHEQGQHRERAKTPLERLFSERDPRVHRHIVDDHRLAFHDRAPGKAVLPGRFFFVEPERYHPDVVLAHSLPSHGLHPIRFRVHEAEPCQPESPGPDHDPAGFAKQFLALTHAHNGRVDSAQHRVNPVEAGDVPLLLLAGEKLPDLAADHVHGTQQPVLRLPDLAAVEGEHADRLAFGIHGKDDPTVQSRVASKLGLLDAGIAGDVGDPKRLSRLPHLACRADARGATDVARFFDEPFDVGAGDAPGLAEPQSPALLVRAEIPSDVPALRLAYRADDRLQADRRAVGARDVPDHGVLERKQLLLAPALRAGGSLAHRPLDRGRETHEVGLEDVVGRAVLQRPDGVVLTKGSGDEDERNVGNDLARNPERAHAVELRHAEVGEDDMRTEFADLAPEVFLALHAARAHGKACALELAFGELGVARDVFHHQDSEFLAHRPSLSLLNLPTSSSLRFPKRP